MVCSAVTSFQKVEFRSDKYSTFAAHLLSVHCAGFGGMVRRDEMNCVHLLRRRLI